MSIKRHLTACALGISVVFSVAALPLPVQAVELVRWERIPLPVSLHVGGRAHCVCGKKCACRFSAVSE